MHNNLYESRGGSLCFSKAGLAEGTNAATILTAAPNGAGVDYSINGYLYHLADADNIAMDALAEQAADTKCLYLVQVDSSGTVSMKKGGEELTTELDSGEKVLHWPVVDDDRCLLGYILVETDAVTFTNGTTDLGAGGITDTYYDMCLAPTRPLDLSV